MDTFERAIKLLKKYCFMASLDLRHAYYSVPIAEEHRKYLRFIWRGQNLPAYQWYHMCSQNVYQVDETCVCNI